MITLQIRTVFFDLDGTLWPPHRVALPAFRRVLEELDSPVPHDDVLLPTLGYPIEEIWQTLLPDASSEVRQKANHLMAKAELELLSQGWAQPFPGVSDTLEKLHAAGVTLCVLSNCEPGYLQAVPDALGIGHLFAARFCAGDFPGLTKSQILSQVLSCFPQPAAMVGDRWHDIDAGKENNLLTIGCAYGLGETQELAKADYVIQRFSQLAEILL